MNDLDKAFKEETLYKDSAIKNRIAMILHLFVKDEVTLIEAQSELSTVKKILEYCQIKNPEIAKANHTKNQSIAEKAKSIAFDSCDEHVHKLCKEIIELVKD